MSHAACVSGLAAPLREGEVHLWTARMDAFPEDLGPMARALPADERAAATEIRAPQRRRQYLIGRMVLRSLLRRYLGDAAELPFRYLPAGKPLLPAPHAHLQFNLAHSGDLLAVALATSHPVGVDIERVRTILHLSTTAGTYFTDREREWLRSLDEGTRSQGFLLLWTSKEAVAKATGTGISGSWTDLEVDFGPGGPAGVRAAGTATEFWHLIRPQAASDYLVSVAVPRAGATARMLEWHPENVSS